MGGGDLPIGRQGLFSQVCLHCLFVSVIFVSSDGVFIPFLEREIVADVRGGALSQKEFIYVVFR